MLSIITTATLACVRITRIITKIDNPAMADPGLTAGIKIITPGRTIGPQAATIKLTTDRAALETGKARITEIIIARSVGATALVKNTPRETITGPLATAGPLMTGVGALTNRTRLKMDLQKQNTRQTSANKAKPDEKRFRSSSRWRTTYPNMRRGDNCSRNYNPDSEKRCRKCPKGDTHHEFECYSYNEFNPNLCKSCGYKYNHYPSDCKEANNFPPKAPENDEGKN